MNDNPHVMAIIENKMAQARTSRRHGDPDRARDLLDQARIYAAFLGADDADTDRDRRIEGTNPSAAR